MSAARYTHCRCGAELPEVGQGRFTYGYCSDACWARYASERAVCDACGVRATFRGVRGGLHLGGECNPMGTWVLPEVLPFPTEAA